MMARRRDIVPSDPYWSEHGIGPWTQPFVKWTQLFVKESWRWRLKGKELPIRDKKTIQKEAARELLTFLSSLTTTERTKIGWRVETKYIGRNDLFLKIAAEDNKGSVRLMSLSLRDLLDALYTKD